MLRRSFLATAGAVWAQAPPPAVKIRSSVSLSMLPGRLEDKLWAVARAGIQSVEFLGETLNWPEVAKLVRPYDLAVDTISALQDWAATQAAASALHATGVLLPPGTSLAQLHTTAALAAKTDLTVLVNNLDLVKQAGHPRVRLLFDAQQPDAVKQFEAAAPLVSVIHVAEPPAGFYRAVAKAGFTGHIAFTYRPAGDVATSLLRSVDAMRKALRDA